MLGAVAAHAALAIEHAQAAEETNRHRLAVEHLLRVSAGLTGRVRAEEALGEVCEAISDALGFDKVCAMLAEGAADVLVPRAWVGWSDADVARLPHPPLAQMTPLLDPAHETEGCVLLDRERAHELIPEVLKTVYVSATDGHGPLAWRGHWLIVSLLDRDGATIGAIWADDPGDHLLPTTERLQALRAFANQAAAAIEATRHLADMRHLAEHDPLTGLRNRRDFEQRVDNARREGPDGPARLRPRPLQARQRLPRPRGRRRGAAPLRVGPAPVDARRRHPDAPGRRGVRGRAARTPTAPAPSRPPSACAARVREVVRRLPGARSRPPSAWPRRRPRWRRRPT